VDIQANIVHFVHWKPPCGVFLGEVILDPAHCLEQLYSLGGFLFSTTYAFKQIVKFKVLKPGEGLGLIESTTFERLKVFLPDGKVIKINSRVLVEKNRKSKIGFISGKNDVYEELKKVIVSQLTR
jgi:hypothetical protein